MIGNSLLRYRCALTFTLFLAPKGIASQNLADGASTTQVVSLIESKTLAALDVAHLFTPDQVYPFTFEHISTGERLEGVGVEIDEAKLLAEPFHSQLTTTEIDGWLAFLGIGGHIELVAVTTETGYVMVSTLPTDTIDEFSLIVSKSDHSDESWFRDFIDFIIDTYEWIGDPDTRPTGSPQPTLPSDGPSGDDPADDSANPGDPTEGDPTPDDEFPPDDVY